MSEFIDVLAEHELPLGSQRCMNIGGKSLLLCHTETGIYAMENRCSHVALPLEGGLIASDVIRCPAHGATFSIQTGEPTRARRLGPINVFETQVIDGRIQVGLI